MSVPRSAAAPQSLQQPPVIDADDEEVAQAISVIFFFNMLAALFFPALGALLGFSTTSGEAFGIFAGTAVNDTSSVTAAASTWDSLYQLGTQTLDKAVTVKLTRTLAIIPITLVLALVRTKKAGSEGKKVEFKKIFPIPALFLYYIIICKKIQLMPYFFYGTKIIHSFSPETKKRHQISLDGHQTKAIPIFNVVVFIHFPSKKSVSEIVRRPVSPKSSSVFSKS